MAAAIRRQFDAWPVSTIALEAGRAALTEEEYERESRRVNAQAREEFAAALSEIGLSVFPSEANFLLVRLPYGSGAELAGWLESSRILIRRAIPFPGWETRIYGSQSDRVKIICVWFPWSKPGSGGEPRNNDVDSGFGRGAQRQEPVRAIAVRIPHIAVIYVATAPSGRELGR